MKPGRWNVLNSRVILSAVLLGYAVVFMIRPHLPDLLPGYAKFEDIMPVRDWIIWSFMAALGMLAAPRQSLLQRAAQLAACVYFFLVAGTISSSVGLTPSVCTTVIEGLAAASMFGQAQAEVFSRSHLFRRLAAHPPRTWFKKHG